MKTRLLLSMIFMVVFLSLPSFSSVKVAQNEILTHNLNTSVELGDYYRDGVWYFVFGDPVTLEIEYITSYGIGPEILSFDGSILFVSGMGNYADIDVVTEFGSYNVSGWLVFA
jgi:hypothetical protein